ncbi:20212_t:CDS:2 [Gigaspora margarita]|uniref:20212_t:CDS:1 n=1 Tax=Gigaspora margarita TaxID=4874 RepID=A0ABN7UDG6_GIGMA|nr:20212_t:CDS:2 [Gigaspora margarita]
MSPTIRGVIIGVEIDENKSFIHGSPGKNWIGAEMDENKALLPDMYQPEPIKLYYY